MHFGGQAVKKGCFVIQCRRFWRLARLARLDGASEIGSAAPANYKMITAVWFEKAVRRENRMRLGRVVVIEIKFDNGWIGH